ncbi:hypothetical protein P3T76_000941 [Phytophthora citrophthora]|uniref:Uncharacterized protein n=1 Tax=Phytophthora citrophthora TaxID=4793 RepID=A0AAD9GYH7_9STRA|nr:hypothetical protein P3T76_000941 [Phytophthora citrophthora]
MRSWDPRIKLLDDTFEAEMALVDRWKASLVPLFETFWKKDDEGDGLIGDDEDGLCVFNVLKRAVELSGRPGVVMNKTLTRLWMTSSFSMPKI